MSKVIPASLKYLSHSKEYDDWYKNKDTNSFAMKNNINEEKLKQKAKLIAEPILLFDSYEHEKAEDAETFFQTYNIELLSVAGAISSLPALITKTIPFFNKYSEKSKIFKTLANGINKYKNTNYKILGKSFALSKILTLLSLSVSALFYAKGIKGSMKSQLGLIRKSTFDASQNIIDNPKIFAQLTPEQQKELDNLVNDNKNSFKIIDKLKDKVNISSSFVSVADYNLNKAKYEKKKSEYIESIKKKENKDDLGETLEDKVLLEGYLKNVEHDVLETLRKVETISNISYSAMFTGGFLEYLISDKLVEVLHINNKFLSALIKFGAPLITYLILNKNISDIENKAILATKYKYLKDFVKNPLNYHSKNNEKSEHPKGISFIKEVYKDMKEYEKFSRNELPKIRDKMDAKKSLKLDEKQEQDANSLQKNVSAILNNQRENVYEQTVDVKSLSETILGPLDIVMTAIGAKVGHSMAKACKNKKYSRMFIGLGALLAFIPAAIVEAKLTKEQKKAEKIAAMISIKDIKNNLKFTTPNYKDNKIFNNNLQNMSDIFKEFKDILANKS